MSAPSVEEVHQQDNGDAEMSQLSSNQQGGGNQSPNNNNTNAIDVTKMRAIGRWYIGETLGKGGYSWVKKGYDKKTGKCVALKFMAKAESSWADEQTKQVITEIESLKQIRHENVMKLYAYNLNAKYPTKNKEKIECILLVLEYAPGGELFDILYYTSALEDILARTYFRQCIFGLEACHNAGIAHRDLKPQNLLLDSKFNLKITDFGLSKVFESDADSIMKTTYVGTRGYQAPELLLNQNYDLSCDIFSAGVVLFILLTGYPPFEQAQKKDRWFAPLTLGDYSKFWKLHRGCNVSNDEKVKDLIQRMLEFDPKKRLTIADIKKHEWFNGKYLEGKDLIRALRVKHRAMESKRVKDARKMGDLQNSIIKRPIPDIEKLKALPPLYPISGVEGVYDTYTFVHWQTFFNKIYDFISSIGGEPEFDTSNFILTSLIKLEQQQQSLPSLLKVEIQMWKSREFANIVKPIDDDSDDNDDQSNNNDKTFDVNNNQDIYVVRMKRLDGDPNVYKKFEQLLMNKCAVVFTGLPHWIDDKDIKKRDEHVVNQLLNATSNDNNVDNNDDYDAILQNDKSFIEAY